MCGCGAQPNPFTRPKPLNTRTSTQNVSESQSAKTAASGADLVQWKWGWGGALKLHIILVFIIFAELKRGHWASLCLFVYAVLQPAHRPHAACLSAGHIWLRSSAFDEEYLFVFTSLFFYSVPVPLLLLLLEGGRLLGRTCATLAKTRPSSSLTAHFAAQMSRGKSPWHVGTPSFSRDIFTDLLCQLELKHDCSSSPLWMDGW